MKNVSGASLWSGRASGKLNSFFFSLTACCSGVSSAVTVCQPFQRFVGSKKAAEADEWPRWLSHTPLKQGVNAHRSELAVRNPRRFCNSIVNF